MTRTALAAVCRGFASPASLEEVRLDEPQAGEVGIRVEACAICHTDVFYADGVWGGTLPAVFGHEVCGVVEDVGPGVEGLAAGVRVVVGLVRSCGACARCRGGEPALCSGAFRLDSVSPIVGADGARIVQGVRCGGFAERIVVHASQAVPVPAGLAPEAGCLIACGVMTGVGAVLTTAAARPGDTVVVIGTGGVGLNAVQGARIAGAGAVIAVDVSAAKLDLARRLGATHAIDASAEDPVAAIRGLTDGGADHVVVTAGSARAMEQGLEAARRGGALVVVGMPPGGHAAFDPGALAHDGKRILGSKLGGAQPHLLVPRLGDLVARGDLALDPLVSATYPLERIDDAMASMRAGEAIRNVLVMGR